MQTTLSPLSGALSLSFSFMRRRRRRRIAITPDALSKLNVAPRNAYTTRARIPMPMPPARQQLGERLLQIMHFHHERPSAAPTPTRNTPAAPAQVPPARTAQIALAQQTLTHNFLSSTTRHLTTMCRQHMYQIWCQCTRARRARRGAIRRKSMPSRAPRRWR